MLSSVDSCGIIYALDCSSSIVPSVSDANFVSQLVNYKENLREPFKKWCHVPSRSVTLPSRFRHVPNILALSAKSRDFTIQE